MPQERLNGTAATITLTAASLRWGSEAQHHTPADTLCPRPPFQSAARLVKETMDKKYNESWVVVIGQGFAFEVTHEVKHVLWMYFWNIAILVYKGVCAPARDVEGSQNSTRVVARPAAPSPSARATCGSCPLPSREPTGAFAPSQPAPGKRARRRNRRPPANAGRPAQGVRRKDGCDACAFGSLRGDNPRE